MRDVYDMRMVVVRRREPLLTKQAAYCPSRVHLVSHSTGTDSNKTQGGALVDRIHLMPVQVANKGTMGRRPLQMRTLLQIGPSRLPSLTFGSGKVSHT